MQTAEVKLIQKNQKTSISKKETTKNKKGVFMPKGKRPDITNLKIVKKDNHLQFNKLNKIDERSMIQIQEGIGEYNLGVKALGNKDYVTAQNYLKKHRKND